MLFQEFKGEGSVLSQHSLIKLQISDFIMAHSGQNTDVFLSGFFYVNKVKWKTEGIVYITQFYKYFIEENAS